MNRRRKTIAAVIVAIGAVVYGISPIDIIPELVAGPLGILDDLGVVGVAGIAIWKLLSGRDPKPGTPPTAS